MDITRFERLQTAANNDPEFRIAARFWDTVLRITMGDTAHLLYIRDGQMTAVRPWDPMQQVWTSWQVSITAPAEDWSKFLAPLPPPFYQDLWGATLHHGFTVEGDLASFYPYYPAMRRLFDLMRAVVREA